MAAKGVIQIISADDYQAGVNSLTEEDGVDVERKASAAHTALGGGSQLDRPSRPSCCWASGTARDEKNVQAVRQIELKVTIKRLVKVTDDS